MNKPKYLTELEVTQAIARGEIGGFDSFDRYKEARAYQAYLKTLEPKFFRRPSNRPVRWLNNRPGYTMSNKEHES